MFQRLQQRMNRKKVVQETEPDISSFYPDTEDGTAGSLGQNQNWLKCNVMYFK